MPTLGTPGTSTDFERPLFRCFGKEHHANVFANGSIRLSTLIQCREYEDAERGDRGEGTLTYFSGNCLGDGSDADIQLVAARMGIEIGPDPANLDISQNVTRWSMPDGYVLCTTEVLNEEILAAFGPYCVEIASPWHFFRGLHAAIERQMGISGCQGDRVVYKERILHGTEPWAGPPTVCFQKPLRYRSQREVRGIWFPLNDVVRLDPIVIPCPEVRHLLKPLWLAP